MKFHYWITKKDKILPLYYLRDKGKNLSLKKCIYKTENSIPINRCTSLVENKVISEMDILEDFNVVELSSECRFIFNNKITILEIEIDENIKPNNQKSIDVARDIFFSLTDTSNDIVLFFIDN